MSWVRRNETQERAYQSGEVKRGGVSPLTSQAKNQAEALIYAKASNALKKQEKQESLKEAFLA